MTEKVVLSERRLTDDEFVERFVEQATKLCDMGFTAPEVRGMMADTEWVRDYVMQPMMFELAGKLPKGTKWSQGQKLGGRKAYGKKADPVPPLVFLDVGTDLYIKGIGYRYERNADGSFRRDERGRRCPTDAIAVIRDWRQYMACDVVNAYNVCVHEHSALFDDAIYQWYHEHGEPLINLPTLHKPGERPKRAIADPVWSYMITPEFLKTQHILLWQDPEHYRLVKRYYGWDMEILHPENDATQKPPLTGEVAASGSRKG